MDGSLFVGAAVPVDAITKKPATPSWWSLKRLLIAGLALLILSAAAVYGNYYWQTGRFLVSTDDAYVAAHSVLISPRVSGYISEVPVGDNDKVKAGQVLARIDPHDYQTALDQARANVAAAQAAIDTLNRQIDQQKLTIEQARQLVASDQAALVFSQQDFQRYTDLAKTGYGTAQRAQQAQADIREKQAALERDTTGVGVAGKQIGVFEAQLAQAKATLAQQQAIEHQAVLNLSYTTITAPEDGTVGVRTLRVGQYVQPGTQLMAVVPLQAVYVTANYMETQLTDVRPGQPVTLTIDTFPDAKVHGHVDSLAPASGQEFALLPPDNATGNFTKIVQRIPVKIDVDRGDPLAGVLRPGMSVEPTIDTRPTNAAPLSGRL
ncbi:MAG TPA: HlyD family secretion protein [Stellaceae bacterium]|jgi:membrane fusion protein (multidrug efflux system)|nr:HlyD family secretion protein [Stellaceae bacterium]